MGAACSLPPLDLILIQLNAVRFIKFSFIKIHFNIFPLLYAFKLNYALQILKLQQLYMSGAEFILNRHRELIRSIADLASLL